MRACGRCWTLKEWDDDALHDGRPAGPASGRRDDVGSPPPRGVRGMSGRGGGAVPACNASRSEEHTSELQSPCNLVCRLLLEKKKKCTSLEASCVNSAS